MTTTALFLILSGVMIGAGLSIIWRDIKRNRRKAFVLERDARSEQEPDVQITISPAGGQPRAVGAEVEIPGTGLPTSAPAAAVAASAASNGVSGDVDGRRAPAMEQRWAALHPVVSAGVGEVNRVLAPIDLMIAEPGDATWSYQNRGYGTYRRVLLAGESMGWLRLEVAADGKLYASMKAHTDERGDFNAVAETAADQLGIAQAGDLLSRCLAPVATHASQAARHANLERQASEHAWNGVSSTVAAALKATNGAFAQAGATLVPVAPAAWEESIRRYRLSLAVRCSGDDVARMHIERLGREIEVSVGVRDAHLAELGRRRRIAVEGLTIHALAELVASCAWPVIARFREPRRTSPHL